MRRRSSVAVLLAIILFACDTASTVPSPGKNYFLKYYGDEGLQTGVDVEIDPNDGSFIMLGTSKVPTGQPTDNVQLYVVKADAQGNVLWENTYGGPLDEEARDIEITSTGDYVLVANSYVSPGSRDILLMTLNADGSVKKSRLINNLTNLGTGPDADDDAATVTETSDGFVVAGSTDNLHGTPNVTREGLCYRVTPDLDDYPNWPAYPSFGQGPDNATTKIVQLPNSNFYCFGSSKFSAKSTGVKTDFDFLMFTLDNFGVNTEQNVSIGNPNIDEKLGAVVLVPSSVGSGYFLAGTSTTQGGNNDLYVVKLKADPINDSIPEIGPKQLNLSLSKLKQVHVGAAASKSFGYLILTNEETTGKSNLLLTKIDGDGQPVWQSPLIYGGQGDDFAGTVKELPDGKVVIIGTITIGPVDGETKMCLIKVNAGGQFAD